MSDQSKQSAGQQRRAHVQTILDKISSDPAYRQELVDNPGQAMAALGVTSSGAADEVSGYLMCQETCGANPLHTCNSGTCTWTAGR